MSKTGEKETPKKCAEKKEPKCKDQLLKEYDELKDFYKNDDKIGMNIVSFGTLINSGLFSVVAIIFSSELPLADRLLSLLVVGIVGIFANLSLFLRQSRINLYMEAWMLQGRHAEKILREKGYDFTIFETQRMIQEEKKFEYKKDGKTKTRCLRDAERFGGHRLSLRSWQIFVLVWLAIGLSACVRWLTL